MLTPFEKWLLQSIPSLLPLSYRIKLYRKQLLENIIQLQENLTEWEDALEVLRKETFVGESSDAFTGLLALFYLQQRMLLDNRRNDLFRYYLIYYQV